MKATLGWARFLLASTSEEGIESSDEDVAAVEASGEAVAVVLGASHEAVAVMLGASHEAVPVVLGASDEAVAVVLGASEEAVAAVLGAGASDVDGEGLDEVQIDSPDPNLIAHQKNAISAQKDDRNTKNKQLDEEKFNARYSLDVGVAALNPAEIDTVKAKSEVKVAALKPLETLCLPSTGKRKEFARSLEQKQKVYRTTYGEIFRDPRHVPKKANPKSKRSKGFDMVTIDGKVISPSKLKFQGILVTEYNNVLLGLYKLGFKIELIELCEKANKQKGIVFAMAMKKASYSFDIGVVELLREARTMDDFFEAAFKHLKEEFSKSRSVGWSIRCEVMNLKGKPVNYPFSREAKHGIPKV